MYHSISVMPKQVHTKRVQPDYAKKNLHTLWVNLYLGFLLTVQQAVQFQTKGNDTSFANRKNPHVFVANRR